MYNVQSSDEFDVIKERIRLKHLLIKGKDYVELSLRTKQTLSKWATGKKLKTIYQDIADLQKTLVLLPYL